jgi:hypothetical protein
MSASSRAHAGLLAAAPGNLKLSAVSLNQQSARCAVDTDSRTQR